MKNQHDVQTPVATKVVVACASCLAFLAPLAVSLFAGETRQKSDSIPLDAIETKAVDGFLIGVAGCPSRSNPSTNNTSTDDPLIYVIWTTGSRSWVAYPAEPAYAYEIELFDTNGLAVPKTALGKKFGSKFYDFGPTTEVKRCPTEKKGKAVPMNYLFSPAHADSSFHPFPPSDLFRITNPGRYILRLRFQILAFPRTGPNRGDYTNNLIRFPPLDYPLLKAANSLTNLPSRDRRAHLLRTQQ